jgi:hypothetical protein
LPLGRGVVQDQHVGFSVGFSELRSAPVFHPYVFTWMIHIFPYEPDFKEVFSMNDDVAHVH